MKILLDECVPARLGRLLTAHEVATTTASGWAGIKNGELLQLASTAFDVFVTVDRNLAFQQNLANLPIPVIVIHSRSNKLLDLQPHLPAVKQTRLALISNRASIISAAFA